MAIKGEVYSPKQYELYIGIEQSAFGTAEDTASDFVKLDVATVGDIDWSGGLTADRTLRTGQQVKKPADHYSTQQGGTWTLPFEWVVSHEEGLQQLLQLVTEDTSPNVSVVRLGSASPLEYGEHGQAANSATATVIISNPYTSEDRVLTSAVVQDLTLSMDAGTAGGRLVASGTFWTGYTPTIGSNTVSPAGTQTSYVKGLYHCTTKNFGAASSELDLVARSFSYTISFPATRLGYQGSAGDPETYSRSGEYSASGTMQVKYDANSLPALTALHVKGDGTASGKERSINFGDGSAINFDLLQVIVTGYTKNMDEEAGVFVDISFDSVALAGEAIHTLIFT